MVFEDNWGDVSAKLYDNVEIIKKSKDLSTNISEIILKWSNRLGRREFITVFGEVYDYIYNERNVEEFSTDEQFNRRIDAELENIYNIKKYSEEFLKYSA